MRARLATLLVFVAAGACRSSDAFTDIDVSRAGGTSGSGGRGGRGGASSSSNTGGSPAGTGGSAGAAGAMAPVPSNPPAADASGPAADTAPVADAAPIPPPDAAAMPLGRALFVVADPVPTGTDITIRDRLAAQLMVDTVADETITPTSANGRVLVVVSASTVMTALNMQLNDVKVPVLLLEPNLMPVMGLTAAPNTAHGGTMPVETQLALVGSGHPLHAGLSGTVTVFTGGGRTTWGQPGPAAIKIATLVGRPMQVAIFAYPAGAMMVGRTAPAKRLALFIQDNTSTLAPDGVKLLDAAITWLIQN